MDSQDTIVAIATAPGEGGIGIVRLSGVNAEKFLKLYFNSAGNHCQFTSHRLYYGQFRHTDGDLVDEVMAVIMRAPRSYTMEDVVEVHCHGGSVVLRRIVDLFIDAGARLARPGEFTLRAFLNGRIDLTRAEAVIEVIRSRSEAACRVALGQLEGRLSQKLFSFRDDISDLLAEVEAGIDFPEEELPLIDRQRLIETSTYLEGQMAALLDSFESGRLLRDGLSILIFGKPNVGKSSLMNTLLGEARTIVSDIPGTTRDTVEESLILRGMPLRLIDTAGVRQTLDPVEIQGVERAQAKVAGVDLVLLVVDGSQALDEDDQKALQSCDPARTLLVLNKQDLGDSHLPTEFLPLPAFSISARSSFGIDQLLNGIVSFFSKSAGSEGRETTLLSDRRHRESLLLARNALERFRVCLAEDQPSEFGALELREALQALGEITGETAPEDILEKIFTRFCIGK
ncbi:tRNA uridine(34) 5-carboxymethylaminomethyl synthesis GTPase MnmE [Syntrophotalea acetylenivorans]|uniref:tRNA modification GTPase MnmE n=1 Tax=Syntrophotalea acetylenivorans TaxID=1842532 RepID=A0A1L3GT22_9BACT|nr:tRNA uridine(34) 5-carboxymethylaminomethyl synthesis GTPase MnmE [Syntrophotalea acetylenivorans]